MPSAVQGTELLSESLCNGEQFFQLLRILQKRHVLIENKIQRQVIKRLNMELFQKY